MPRAVNYAELRIETMKYLAAGIKMIQGKKSGGY